MKRRLALSSGEGDNLPAGRTGGKAGRSMLKRLVVIALLAFLALTGCAFTTYAPITSCGAPVSHVQVLNAFPADGTFTRCGSIVIEGGMAASYETAIGVAKDEARRHGANAIVIILPPGTSQYLTLEGNAVAIWAH